MVNYNSIATATTFIVEIIRKIVLILPDEDYRETSLIRDMNHYCLWVKNQEGRSLLPLLLMYVLQLTWIEVDLRIE